MAEPISAFITVAATALKLIRETINFIQEARDFDRDINDIINKLSCLERSIETVKQIYERRSDSGRSEPPDIVLDCLAKCEGILSEISHKVDGLACLKSSTWLQKIASKVKSTYSKKEVEKAIQDMHFYLSVMSHVGGTITLANMNMGKTTPQSQELLVEDITRTEADLHIVVEEALPVTYIGLDWTPPNMNVLALYGQDTEPINAFNIERIDSATAYPETLLGNEANSRADFHYQVRNCTGNADDLHTVKTILQRDPQLAMAPDGLGRTPLHIAAQYGNIELGRILLGCSADINAQDSEPASVLDFAVAHNQEHFVAFLLANGVTETVLKQNRQRFEEIQYMLEEAKRAADKPIKTTKTKNAGVSNEKLNAKKRRKTSIFG